MKKFKNGLVFFLVACLMMTTFISCSSTEEPTENVATTQEEFQEELADSQMRAIFGISDEDVDVATYRIRGEARDGASFDWVEVTEPQVVIAGVRRGEWTIYAQALNADGEVLVSGRLDTFLSSDAPTDNLTFVEQDGTGSVDTKITWNTAQVQNPSIQVFLKEDGGQFLPREADEVVFTEDGVAYWRVPTLDAGSYIARFVFSDNGTVVGGAAAALRVLTDHTSIGSVEMTVSDLNTAYSIYLENTPADVTDGTLVNDNGNITFSAEENAGDLAYEWYVNGEYVEGVEGDCLDMNSLELEKGLYRVDVVAQNETYGSINSFSTVIQLENENVYLTVSADSESVGITPDVITETAEPAEAAVVEA